MLSRRALALTAPAIALLAACDRIAPPPQPPPRYTPYPTAEAAAEQALRDLVHLVTTTDYADFGFHAFAELAIAKLGDPMAIYYIPLDRLRAYTPASASVESLLVQSHQTLYPVTVQGSVRSSVVITQDVAGYHPGEMGEAPVMQTVAAYRKGAGADEFVVRTPGLNAVLLGRRATSAEAAAAGVSLYLTPLFAQPGLGLPVGVAQPAQRVLVPLASLARQANDLPA